MLVNLCSLYPVFIEVFIKNKNNGDPELLLTATGFIYSYNSQKYLISNWHVFSGKNPNEPTKFLDNVHGEPEWLRVHYPQDGAVESKILKEYRLKADDTCLWKEHPNSNKVDVAALEVDVPDGVATFEINNAMRPIGNWSKENFFYVSQEVWVIGFPQGIRVSGLPIWKRATIASEPLYSMKEVEHKIILDTATRQGMSGSPVLYVGGSIEPVPFDGRSPVDRPALKMLLGVYSGRIVGEDALSAQLGIVWSSDCIEEILTGLGKAS